MGFMSGELAGQGNTVTFSLEVVSNNSGSVRSCVVVLQDRSSWLLLEERNDDRSQYLIDVSLASQITS